MGKNSDIESISNSLSIMIVHELLADYGNKEYGRDFVEKEALEYRSQSLKKIRKLGREHLNDKDKQVLKIKLINKITNKLKLKYPDVSISQEEIEKKVEEEMNSFDLV